MEFDNVKGFADYLGVQRGLSPATVQQYKKDLRYYAEWLVATGKELVDIGPNDMDAYALYMAGELGLSPATCKRRVASISAYNTWLMRVGELKSNPVYKIMLPKSAKRLPVYIAKEEIPRFEEVVEEEVRRRPIVGARNRALIYLMMYGGLRISEALSLKEANITFENEMPAMLTVVGKGNKERQVDLGKKAIQALHYWMAARKTLRDNDDLARKLTRKNYMELTSAYIFPGRDGRPLNMRTVQKKIESMRGIFGGAKKLTPHKLRHTYATLLIGKGVDLQTTRDMLGHASIATTQIYVHVDKAQRRAAAMLL